MPYFTVSNNKTSYKFRLDSSSECSYPVEIEGSYWINSNTLELSNKIYLTKGNYNVLLEPLENETEAETLSTYSYNQNYYIFAIGTGVFSEDVAAQTEYFEQRISFLGKISYPSTTTSISLNIDDLPISVENNEEQLNNIKEPNQVLLYFLSKTGLESGIDVSEDTEQICNSFGEKVQESEISSIPLNKYYSISYQVNGNNYTPNFTEGSIEETLYNVYVKYTLDNSYESKRGIISLYNTEEEIPNLTLDIPPLFKIKDKILYNSLTAEIITNSIGNDKNLIEDSPESFYGYGIKLPSKDLSNIRGIDTNIEVPFEITLDGIELLVIYKYTKPQAFPENDGDVYKYLAIMKNHGLGYYVGNGNGEGGLTAPINTSLKKEDTENNYSRFYWGPQGSSEAYLLTNYEEIGGGLINCYNALHQTEVDMSIVGEEDRIKFKTMWTGLKQFREYYPQKKEDKKKWFIPSSTELLLLKTLNSESVPYYDLLTNLEGGNDNPLYYTSTSASSDEAHTYTFGTTGIGSVKKHSYYPVRLFRAF